MADEVKQWKQKMAKWKGQVAERLQILERRARGESIDTVHDQFRWLLCGNSRILDVEGSCSMRFLEFDWHGSCSFEGIFDVLLSVFSF